MTLKKADDRNNKMTGLYKKAMLLYNKERYKESYNVIVKAIELVKEDIKNEEIFAENSEQNLREKLGVPHDIKINQKSVYKQERELEKLRFSKPDGKAQDFDFKDSDEDEIPEDLGVEKMQLLVDIRNRRPETVAAYLKIQIEDLYKKIVAYYKTEQLGVKFMQNKSEFYEKKVSAKQTGDVEIPNHQKIRQAEDEDKARRVRLTLRKNLMCQNIKEFGVCNDMPWCDKAHNATELDLLTNKQKYSQISKGCEAVKIKMKDSKAIHPWRPTQAAESIDTSEVDYNFKKNQFFRTVAEKEKLEDGWNATEQDKRIAEMKSTMA